MGSVVRLYAEGLNSVKITAGLDRTENTSAVPPVFESPREIAERPDVILDFSLPSALPGILEYATEQSIPYVSAVTGYGETERELLRGAADKIPVLWSANFSVGIGAILEIVAQATKLLGKSCDIEILESHHRRKADAPSGTALTLAQTVREALPEPYTLTTNRADRHEPRRNNEIGIHSVRGGNIVGEHSVMFIGENETVTLTHSAASRDIFAEGALAACVFLHNKPAKLYTMKDFLMG